MANKDHTRDYATAAFRFYAAEGGLDKYKQKVWNTALQSRIKSEAKVSGISKPTETDIMYAQKALDEVYAAIADLEAVERTLYIIDNSIDGRAIKQALETVYFTDANNAIEKGDIQMRVHKASLKIPAGERTVYRYLSKIRQIFSFERGLRI